MLPDCTELKRRVNSLAPDERLRVLHRIAFRYPSSLHDCLGGVRPRQSVRILGWSITGISPEGVAGTDPPAAMG